MTCHCSTVWTISISITFAAATLTPSMSLAGDSWVLIFSPAGYRELAPAPQLARGATALRSQLLKAGYRADHVVCLSGPKGRQGGAATAANLRRELDRVVNLVGPDDLLFVALVTHGLSIGQTDYLCAADSSVDEIRSLLNPNRAVLPPKTLVTTREITQRMAVASSKRRFLVVDTTAGISPFRVAQRQRDFVDLTSSFGSHPLPVTNDQWIVCNRSSRLTRAANRAASMTCFMQSVVNGLQGDADGNDDANVSLFELLDYVQSLAEAEGYTPPAVHGRAHHDFVMATVTEPRAMRARLPAELRHSMARTMLDSATNSLLLERDARSAMEALQWASALSTFGPESHEMYSLVLSTLALRGEVLEAHQRAIQDDYPLFVQVTTRTFLYPDTPNTQQQLGTPSNGQVSTRATHYAHPAWPHRPTTIEDGTVLRAVKLDGGRLHVDQAYTPVVSVGTVSYRRVDVKPGWIDAAAVTSNDHRQNDSHPLLSAVVGKPVK